MMSLDSGHVAQINRHFFIDKTLVLARDFEGESEYYTERLSMVTRGD